MNLLRGETLVQVCLRVAYPNIKERRLFSRPEAPSGASLVPSGSTYLSENRLHLNLSTHRLENFSLEISNFVVPLYIYPPRIQIIAWSASNKSPLMHTVGMPLKFQRYLNLRWLNRVMQDHEARNSDLNRKLIFSFFFAIFLNKATET